MENSIHKKVSRPLDLVLMVVIYACAGCSILLLTGIMLYIFMKGWSSVNWLFLTTVPSTIKGSFGILGNIIHTLYMIIITLLLAVPIGVGAAVYLNEYAKPGKMVRFIEFTTETLAGIPSIIFGLFGMVFFGNTLRLGYSILTGSLTLTIMILPLIIRNTQEALKTVPNSYRQGALGVGAGKWYMIRTVLLPSALPGILTGVILSVGRIVGESAALLFTAGSGFLLPKVGDYGEGLFHKIFESGGTLTIQLYLSMQKAEYGNAFGIALVLLFIILGINLLTKYLIRRFDVNRR